MWGDIRVSLTASLADSYAVLSLARGDATGDGVAVPAAGHGLHGSSSCPQRWLLRRMQALYLCTFVPSKQISIMIRCAKGILLRGFRKVQGFPFSGGKAP